jgi:hypothetical protein
MREACLAIPYRRAADDLERWQTGAPSVSSRQTLWRKIANLVSHLRLLDDGVELARQDELSAALHVNRTTLYPWRKSTIGAAVTR